MCLPHIVATITGHAAHAMVTWRFTDSGAVYGQYGVLEEEGGKMAIGCCWQYRSSPFSKAARDQGSRLILGRGLQGPALLFQLIWQLLFVEKGL